MALKHKEDTGLKKEHVIIAILLASLIGLVAYFVMQKQNDVATPVVANTAQQAPEQAKTPTAPQEVRYGMALGKYNGEVHPIVKILSDLKGFKYDESVAAEDTVYIIYDPRCPYCHQLLEKVSQIDLKAKGITVKWLPTTALGDSPEAAKLATLGIRAKDPQAFTKTFEKGVDTSGVTPSAEEADALNENLAFLLQASAQVYGEQQPPSVPAVFFIDKKQGSPNMMYGASDPEIFKQIFGE